MQKVFRKPTGYKSTGNIAVDMVASCIDHHARWGKKLAYIRLEHTKWELFIAYVKNKIPGYDFSDGYVEFDGVRITEGSSLQLMALYAELISEIVN